MRGWHHWARPLQSFGHEVKLVPPQYIKPYVKRGKNDAADAEALCEALSRPTMRFVPVKTAKQQAAFMLVGLRDRLIRNRKTRRRGASEQDRAHCLEANGKQECLQSKAYTASLSARRIEIGQTRGTFLLV